jgi:hypothetical protein
MKTLADRYHALFAEGMANTLIPAGFKRRKPGLFVRDGEEVIQMVGTQRSVSSTKEFLKVTVNAGLTPKAMALKLELRRFPPASPIDCSAWARISDFASSKDDLWWRISDQGQAEQAAREVADALEHFVLPRLNKVVTADEVLIAWTSAKPLPPYFRVGRDVEDEFVEALRKSIMRRH